MACSLLALGSNLGDRAGTCRRALAELRRLPGTRLIARSRMYETAPVGGPSGQGRFLNGAALIETVLAQDSLLQGLRGIEAALGRKPAEHWAARIIDLDLLLYDGAVGASADLAIPHPRMAYRRFVLEPAAEVAAAMLHPETGWTVGALEAHLNRAPDLVAIAGPTAPTADELVAELSQRLGLPVGSRSAKSNGRPNVVRWTGSLDVAPQSRPKLLLAMSPGGVGSAAARRMLHLPERGPVAWINDDPAKSLDEAIAAVQSVWPALAK